MAYGKRRRLLGTAASGETNGIFVLLPGRAEDGDGIVSIVSARPRTA